MAKLPFMQFYPDLWIQDTRVLSHEARGVWIDLLCSLWVSKTRGLITWTERQWENFIGTGEDSQYAKALWNELSESGVADMEFDEASRTVTVKSRRMLREETQRNQASTRQSRRRHAEVTEESRRILQKTEDILQKTYKNKIPPPAEAVELAQLLSDKIFENLPTRTPPTEAQLIAWACEADRLYRIDGHGWPDIRQVLEWSQRHTFWQSNILSMGALRKQWNRLVAQMNRPGENNGKAETPADRLRQRTRETLRRGLDEKEDV